MNSRKYFLPETTPKRSQTSVNKLYNIKYFWTIDHIKMMGTFCFGETHFWYDLWSVIENGYTKVWKFQCLCVLCYCSFIDAWCPNVAPEYEIEVNKCCFTSMMYIYQQMETTSGGLFTGLVAARTCKQKFKGRCTTKQTRFFSDFFFLNVDPPPPPPPPSHPLWNPSFQKPKKRWFLGREKMRVCLE